MVLGNENHVLGPSSLDSAHPLLGIKVGGSKYFRIGRTVSPFSVEKRVRSKMNDDSELQVLPFDLLRGGLYVGEILRVQGRGAGENRNQF